MGCNPQVLIDLAALRLNLQRARDAAPNSRVMAVIKADGYGHGMLRVARALEEADALAVGRVIEGIQLREAGEERPITVLEGFSDRAELETAARLGLELVIHEQGQLELLESNSLEEPVHCWLKLDTGMHRLGFPVSEAQAVAARLMECPSVVTPIRLMTHLAQADDLSSRETDHQLEQFREVVRILELESSSANSGGILGWKESHVEWIRPGIMLYGSSPFQNKTGPEEGLAPVMTFSGRLIAVNQFREGDGIGYGGSWRCPEDMKIGVIAAGYGDGYPRHAPPGTPVLLNGQRVPLVGRVSMDMITVDLRKQPQAKVGDLAILWGRGLPAEEVAESAGTISYELFCGLAGRKRVELVEVGAEEKTSSNG
jgi:alanine racemase